MTGVVVVGSVNLDLVVRVARLPRPGETALGSQVQYRLGGKGANQAVVAHRMGAAVSLFAALGEDSFAADLRANLVEQGIDLTDVVTIPDHPSGVALIVVQADGENTVTVAPGVNACLTPDHFAGLSQRLRADDALLLQMEIPVETNIAAAGMARRVGVPVILNAAPLPDRPCPRISELLRLADVLVVNETEARQLGSGDDSENWTDRADNLRRWGSPAVVVTLGARGAVAADADGVHVEPAFSVDAVDVTGAGDAFCGALAVGLAAGMRMPAALRHACAAGAIATTRVGAQRAAPNADQVAELTRRDDRRGFVTQKHKGEFR